MIKSAFINIIFSDIRFDELQIKMVSYIRFND